MLSLAPLQALQRRQIQYNRHYYTNKWLLDPIKRSVAELLRLPRKEGDLRPWIILRPRTRRSHSTSGFKSSRSGPVWKIFKTTGNASQGKGEGAWMWDSGWRKRGSETGGGRWPQGTSSPAELAGQILAGKQRRQAGNVARATLWKALSARQGSWSWYPRHGEGMGWGVA